MIKNSYCTAAVNGIIGYVGGISGQAHGSSTITVCYATGNISGGVYLGGIVGNSIESTIIHCVALNQTVSDGDGATSSRVVGSFSTNLTGSIAGNYAWSAMTVNGSAVTDGTSTNKNGADLSHRSGNLSKQFSAIFTADADVWSFADNALPMLKNVGGNQNSTLPAWISGAPAADLEIKTAAEMKAFADAVNGGNNYNGKTVVLSANIDLSTYDNWTPIGTTLDKAFTGIFDGNGYAIHNLTINGGTFQSENGNPPIVNLGTTGGTATISGGTFVNGIGANDSNLPVLSGILEEGYCFRSGTTASGTLVKISPTDRVITGTVTVGTHEHSYVTWDTVAHTSACEYCATPTTDSTAPTLSAVVAPVGGNLTDTTAKITFTADDTGDFFYPVKKSGEAAPSVTDILAEATSKTAMKTDATNAFTLSNLLPNTAYTVSMAATDKAGNNTASATNVSFTTLKAAIKGTVTLDKTAPKFGEPITATPDVTTAGAGTLSYKWYRDSTEMSGETAATYTTVAADVGKKIKAEVAAANCTGSLSSAFTETVAASIAAPVTAGTVLTGDSVTADTTTAKVVVTVTYTVRFANGSTPTLALGGNNGTLSAPTKSATENKWTYTYVVTTGDSNITATATFVAKKVESISNTTGVTLFADDGSNNDAAALNAYLDSSVKVTATYDNGTTEQIAASYATTDAFVRKGKAYTYTATADGKTCNVTVTIKSVTAAITATPDILKTKNAVNGYPTHARIGLPTNATITYTGDGYTKKTDTLTVMVAYCTY